MWISPSHRDAVEDDRQHGASSNQALTYWLDGLILTS